MPSERPERGRVPKKPNTRQSERTRGSNTGLPEWAEFRSRVRLLGVLTQTFLVLSLSENWFSQPSEEKAAETKFSAQLTYVRTWWRLGSSILSSPVPPRWFPSPSSPPTSWYAVGAKAFTSSLELSSAQRADAPPLEPSLEALLREVNCHEEVIMAFRVQEIVDRGLFVAVDAFARQHRRPSGLTRRKGLPTNVSWLRS